MSINVPSKARTFIDEADAPADKTVTITFTAGAKFVSRFDELVKKRGVSRAALIKVAMSNEVADAEAKGEL